MTLNDHFDVNLGENGNFHRNKSPEDLPALVADNAPEANGSEALPSYSRSSSPSC